MTPEGKIKKRIKQILEELNIWYFMPPANGYGRAGIPDFVGCLNGLFIAIEAKAGKGKTTALQNKEIALIKASGGFAIVVNETNIEQLKDALEQWAKQEWISSP